MRQEWFPILQNTVGAAPVRILKEQGDVLASVFSLHNAISNWEELLRLSSKEELKMLKQHERTGRPLGNEGFLYKLEQTLGEFYDLKSLDPKRKMRVRYPVPGIEKIAELPCKIGGSAFFMLKRT